MSVDVCVCGHLEQAHRGDEDECGAPACECGGFASEDESESEQRSVS